MQVDFKIHGIFKADPEKCYNELPDEITPENVLERARDEKSELHKCFEWDDSVAAEKYRLTQARMLIQLFVVKSDDEERTYHPRIFQVTSERNKYERATFFIRNPDEYSVLLGRAKKELHDFQTRYKEIAELETVNEAISNFLTNNI
jgi:hypothetical protein